MKIKNNCEHLPIIQSNLAYQSSYIKLSKSRIIIINEDITKASATELAALLLYYDYESNEPISLYINCVGGDAIGLSSIYDVIKMIKSPVHTLVLGKAYSAAAVILAAGTKGYRAAFESARIMIHGIQALYPIPGQDLSNNTIYLNFINGLNKNIMQILADCSGKTFEQVHKDCLNDCYLTAKQALQYGLIDKII